MKESVLKISDKAIVNVVWDTVTNTGSIGVNNGKEQHFKFISKECYDILMKELKDQDGIYNKR